MRALRLGSYSMAATLAGTPSLSRRKSITRYRRLWPPVPGSGATSERSGRSRVISEKSATLWNRRPGLVGFLERTGIAFSSALEEVDFVAGVQRHEGALRVGALAGRIGATVAGRLALAIQGVHVVDLHAEGLLDREADLDLGRAGVDHE